MSYGAWVYVNLLVDGRGEREEVIGDLHLRKGGWRCASSSRLDAGRRGRGQGRCERGSSVLSSLFDGCWLRRARS